MDHNETWPLFVRRHLSMQPPPPPPDHSSYLPHLDGLRAVALFGVLAFHFKLPLPGGYRGVDAFLVLSAYLITRNITRSLPTFSFRAFYTARFWRLYPLAVVIIAATLAFSFALSHPDHALETCQSAAASLALSSNFYFHAFSRYFDAASVHRPLLHMWSLSLEEQFYLIWPAFLVLSTRYLRSPAAAVASVAAASLALNIVAPSPDFAFYLLPPRAFEFAAGALLHILHKPLSRLSAPIQNILSTTGLALLLSSFHAGALLPATLTGTALLIITPAALLSRIFLASAPMRHVGRLSYAAYLTHWPIAVFAGEAFPGHHGTPLYAPSLTLATFITATALHTHVESPLRCPKLRATAPKPLVLVPLLLATALAAIGHVSSGWRFRFPPTTTSVADNRRLLHEACAEINPSNRLVFDPATAHGCLVGPAAHAAAAPLPSPTLASAWVQSNAVAGVVIGNSFARHLTSAFGEALSTADAPLLFTWRFSCRTRPLAAVPSAAPVRAHDPCLYSNYLRWHILANLPKNTSVFLAQNWDITAERPPAFLTDELASVTRDVRHLGLRPVIVTAPPGAVGVSYLCHDLRQSLLAPLRALGRLLPCPSAGAPREKSASAYRVMLEFARGAGVPLLDLYGHLCGGRDGQMCDAFPTLRGKKVRLYVSDMYHLTHDGSRALAPFVRKRLRELM